MNEKEFYYSCKKGPNLISYDITNKYNLQCVYCYNESGECYEQDLADYEIRSVRPQLLYK